jgi:hypothetical protein
VNHPLLKTSKRGQLERPISLPPEARYSPDKGVWLVGDKLLAKSPDLVRVTKKADIETGEDNKGS